MSRLPGEENTTRRIAVAAALLAGVTALTACGESANVSSASDATPTSAAPAAPATTQPKIEITSAPKSERGLVWDLAWNKVRNPSLIPELRREGEVFGRDPSADPNKPDSWQKIVVIGVPVEEVENEPERSIAFWTGGDEVEVATINREMPRGKIDGINVYLLRVAIGPEDTTFCFFSGEVNTDPMPDPSWAAESTIPGPVVTPQDPRYTTIPLV